MLAITFADGRGEYARDEVFAYFELLVNLSSDTCDDIALPMVRADFDSALESCRNRLRDGRGELVAAADFLLHRLPLDTPGFGRTGPELAAFLASRGEMWLLRESIGRQGTPVCGGTDVRVGAIIGDQVEVLDALFHRGATPFGSTPFGARSANLAAAILFPAAVFFAAPKCIRLIMSRIDREWCQDDMARLFHGRNDFRDATEDRRECLRLAADSGLVIRIPNGAWTRESVDLAIYANELGADWPENFLQVALSTGHFEMLPRIPWIPLDLMDPLERMASEVLARCAVEGELALRRSTRDVMRSPVAALRRFPCAADGSRGLQFLIETGLTTYDIASTWYPYCFEAGCYDSLAYLFWSHEPTETATTCLAVRYNGREIFEFAVAANRGLSKRVWLAAVRSTGDFARDLYDRAVPFDPRICFHAAAYGRADILEFAISRGAEVDPDTAFAAAMGGHFDCLQIAIAAGSVVGSTLLGDIGDEKCRSFAAEHCANFRVASRLYVNTAVSARQKMDSLPE